jgi:SAM-dependent methyltransferase
MNILLHIGCGSCTIADLPEYFHQGWLEVRLDIVPAYEPDIVASIIDMSVIDEDECFDGVYSSHNLEHLETYQVSIALKEIWRVLKPGGRFWVRTPDLQAIATLVAEDRLEETLVQSTVGPIRPIDYLYGLERFIAEGQYFMAHRTGFTRTSLTAHLERIGFHPVTAITEGLALNELFLVAEKPLK